MIQILKKTLVGLKCASFVITKKCLSAVGKETVFKCKRSVSQSLQDDQNCISNRINALLHTRISTQIINAIRLDVENIFGEDKGSYFIDDVIALYADEKLPPSAVMISLAEKLSLF